MKKILLENHSLCINHIGYDKGVDTIGMLAFAVYSNYLCLDMQLKEPLDKTLKLFEMS